MRLDHPQTEPDVLYQRAVDQLRLGNVQRGSEMLATVVEQAGSEKLRSLAIYNLGQVLEQLGQIDQAYEIWYKLAHKPRETRNAIDWDVRRRVFSAFNEHGLVLRPPDFPPRIQIEVTNRCNLRCIMCTRNQMRRPLADFNPGWIDRIADECAAEPGCGIMLFFLGEPLLHPQLETIVRKLAERRSACGGGLQFTVQTNGMLMTPDRARSLLEAGLRSVFFSLDRLEGELERMRPGSDYGVIERNILDLVDYKRRNKVDDLEISISKICDDPRSAEVRRFRARWQEHVDKVYLLGLTRVAGNRYLDADGRQHTIDAAEAASPPGYCGTGQRLLILADGRFAFCCSDINGEFELGSVEEMSVREAWNSRVIQEVRRHVLRGDYAEYPACIECRAGRR